MIDTHAHLQHADFKPDLAGVIDRAKKAGVDGILTIGTSVEDSLAGVEIASAHSGIYASVGIHPSDVGTWTDQSPARLKSAAASPRVKAIGETGLDYHRSPSPTAKQFQEKAFRAQIQLARELGLPLIIHTRDAHEETLKILEEEKAGTNGGVIHCYTSGWEIASRYLKLGFLISFGGIVTFGKKAGELPEVAKHIPAQMLLLETDCPWLSPEPIRGQRNEPAYLIHIADAMAKFKGMSLKEMAAMTTFNAKKVFRF